MSDSNIELSKEAEEIMGLVGELSVKDLNVLVKVLEERFGVSAMPVILPAEDTKKEEVSLTVDVVLKEYGSQKISVIKMIKDITGKGLKESKDLVDKVPSDVKTGVLREEGEKIKEQLLSVGAIVELR